MTKRKTRHAGMLNSNVNVVLYLDSRNDSRERERRWEDFRVYNLGQPCVWSLYESQIPHLSSFQVSWGDPTSKRVSKELKKRNGWWQKECGEECKSVLHLGTKYKPLFNESESAGLILADRWREKLGNTWHEALDLQPIWRWSNGPCPVWAASLLL